MKVQAERCRILLLADLHRRDFPDTPCDAFVRAVLHNEHPDMVLFLGDMLDRESCQTVERLRSGIASVLAPLRETQTPFAFVFGNHDYEMVPSETRRHFGTDKASVKRRMAALWAEAGGDLFLQPDGISEAEGYNSIYYIRDAHDKPCLALFLFDTGDKLPGEETQDYVTESQQAWFKEQRQRQPGIPAFVFQHIAVPEVFTYFRPAKRHIAFRTPRQKRQVQLTCPTAFGERWLQPPYRHMTGEMCERPCPPAVNGGEFRTLCADGNVKALFFGHDHRNSFTIPTAGIDLVSIPGCGLLHGYGTPQIRGAGVLEISLAAGSYTKRIVTYYEAAKYPNTNLTVLRKGKGLERRSAQFYFYAQRIAGTLARIGK
ncbi:MAG: metallophosphoesterase [Oscillospiraceae bacterium]|jgi:hypothetical protein|nr:metallophosphoesterase [Oscillospiraceae bacterium]